MTTKARTVSTVRRLGLAVAAACAAAGASGADAGATPPANAPLAVFDLAKLPAAQFGRDGWLAPATEGGVACRTAQAGKTATVRVKAWWKDGQLRPDEGAWFILEVKYRDVLAKPAQAVGFGGVGWRFGNSPLHRFGGAQDGQWKIAAIPVPWDMVARLVSTLDPAANQPEMTSFGFTAPADLPIASLTVRQAVPADEANFYAECRAQIAAEQAEARAASPPPAVKTPPAVTGAMAAFPWDPGCRLFQNCAGVAGEMGKTVKVRLCLNEWEAGSFGVYANGAPLTGVDYEITPLTDAAGQTLQATIERRTAEYTILDQQWTPVRLWQAHAVEILPGRSHWFYFNIETKRGLTKAGTYKGKIRIKAREAQAELPLEVEVLPVDLLTIDEAGIVMCGCYSKTPPLHDLAFARRYNYAGMLLWYHEFRIPMAMRDGRLVLDFTYPDDWMQRARKLGFTQAAWYLGGDSAKMPGTLKVFIDLATLDGKTTRDAYLAAQGGKPFVLPEVRKLFVEWMRQVNTYAVAHDWPELFPTPHDEPQKWASRGEWIKGFFQDACAAIHEADPKCRVYGCIHHVKGWRGIADLWKVFADDIEVYNTNNVEEDHDVGNKVRNHGRARAQQGKPDMLFWQYTGLGAGVPESQRFAFGFYFGAHGSVGCTAWAYNWDDNWDLSGRKGDYAVTAWPTVYQTIPSPWFEGQREGLDDRRVIATYQKRFARDPEAMKLLDGILQEAMTSRGKGGADKEAGFFEAVDDAAKLTRWRNQLLEKLAAPPAAAP
jgi:hypothetical protein